LDHGKIAPVTALKNISFHRLRGDFIGRISALLRRNRHQPGKSAGRSRSGNNLWKRPMNKIVAIAFASAAMISTAFAGEIEGVVKPFDAAASTVELESGESFTVAEGVSLEGVEAGKTVMIMFDDGTTVATEIAIVE
jgi:hypothetical protein